MVPNLKQKMRIETKYLNMVMTGIIFVLLIVLIVVWITVRYLRRWHHSQPSGLDPMQTGLALLLTIGATLSVTIVAAVLAHVMSRKDEAQALGKAQELEKSAESQQDLAAYVDNVLAAASERQRAAVSKADRRAGALSMMGTMLMVMAVVVPFGMVALYLRIDPAVTAKQLVQAGVPAAEAAKAAQPDWHLLLAGVSFGLLFIASARGIFLAESRQREVYTREMREATYYGDLSRALGIAQRLDIPPIEPRKEKHTRNAAQTIMALLLEHRSRERPGALAPGSEGAAGGEHEFLKILGDAVKK
jgi:hypothetical protein